MFSRTSAFFAFAAVSLTANPAFALEDARAIDLTYSGQKFTVTIESNDTEVRALADRAIGAHGAFDVKSGSSRRARFSKTSPTSITVSCAIGNEAPIEQTVTGTDAAETLMRACDFVITTFGKSAGVRPLYTGELAFVSDRSGKKEIYCGDLFLTTIRPLTNLNSISITPHWTADGSEVLFTTYYNNNFTDIYAVNRGTRKLRGVVVGIKGTTTGAVSSPSGQIAFSSSSSGNTDIYVAGANGKNARAVINSKDVDSDPAWSHDGTRLAYVSGAAGSPGIYVAFASGSGAKRIRTGSNYTTEPNWNPVDSNKIAFTCQIGGFNIGVADIASGKITQITKTGGYTHPTWCPDGRHIVATKTTGKNSVLVLIDTETDKTGKNKTTTLSGALMKNCSEADCRAR